MNSSYRATEYRYVVINSADHQLYTSIVVQKGVVTSRSYYDFKSVDPKSNAWTIEKSWYEDVKSLNTHSEGAAMVTLDVIYEKAKNEWLTVDRNANNILFEANKVGLISKAGYSSKNCTGSNCFVGIVVESVESLHPIVL